MKRMIARLLAIAIVLLTVGLNPSVSTAAGGSPKSESLSKWCTNNGGISDKTTCTVGDAEVGTGKILLVPPGRTLIVNGILDNNGTIGSSGTIENNGTINNSGALGNNGLVDNCAGSIDNSGTIENNGTISSETEITGAGEYSGNEPVVCS